MIVLSSCFFVLEIILLTVWTRSVEKNPHKYGVAWLLGYLLGWLIYECMCVCGVCNKRDKLPRNTVVMMMVINGDDIKRKKDECFPSMYFFTLPVEYKKERKRKGNLNINQFLEIHHHQVVCCGWCILGLRHRFIDWRLGDFMHLFLFLLSCLMLYNFIFYFFILLFFYFFWLLFFLIYFLFLIFVSKNPYSFLKDFTPQIRQSRHIFTEAIRRRPGTNVGSCTHQPDFNPGPAAVKSPSPTDSLIYSIYRRQTMLDTLTNIYHMSFILDLNDSVASYHNTRSSFERWLWIAVQPRLCQTHIFSFLFATPKKPCINTLALQTTRYSLINNTLFPPVLHIPASWSSSMFMKPDCVHFCYS